MRQPDPGLSAGTIVLALDIGATQIRAGAVRIDGTVLARESSRTPRNAGPDEFISICVAHLARVRDRLDAEARSAVAGVGVGAVGPLDLRAGSLLEPPNLGPSYRGTRIVGPLKRMLGLPVALERDGHVAALGEQAYGAAQGARDFLYLTVSTGIGGAIVAGGRLLTGADGIAGEVGHIPVQLDGPLCGCGDRGHLEAISSGSGIARAALDVVRSGRSPALGEIATRLAPAHLEGIHVAQAEDAGDAVAGAIMNSARRAFAAAMVGFVNVFNPERVVVGGSIARHQGERLLGPARLAVANHSFHTAAHRVVIAPAALGDDVGLIGAVPLLTTYLQERSSLDDHPLPS